MKIGVASDTHRNKELLNNVATWLISEQHITQLYHLGDDYEDVIDLAHERIEVIQIPGIYHKHYLDGSLKKIQIQHVMGLRILLVHSFDKDVNDNERTISDIILYGHTHKAELKLNDGLLLMNPGHLKSAIDKHEKASFGLIEVQDLHVSAKISDLNFEEIMGVKLIRTESGLFKS
jgi:putative phosphoesterase